MRVGLDVQLAAGTSTGIGEYASGLVRALPGQGVEVVPLQCAALDPWRFDRRVAWDQLLLPIDAWRARLDLLHCASGTMPLVRPVPVVTTVHDVAWLRVQQHARPYARAYFGRFALAQYPHARRVLVDSAFSGHELALLGRIDPARIDVVYPGVAADVAGVRRRPDEESFVLALGTVERRKNLATLIRALPELPATVRLVAAGPFTPYRDLCEQLARDVGVAERVTFAGYVPREQLLDLIARAAAIALPSTYEGFGYAAAWALCAGVPLVAADASSLPEVVGKAAPLVAPLDHVAWAAALGAILSDRAAAEARADSVRSAAMERFSWSASAAAAAASYARALAE